MPLSPPSPAPLPSSHNKAFFLISFPSSSLPSPPLTPTTKKNTFMQMENITSQPAKHPTNRCVSDACQKTLIRRHIACQFRRNILDALFVLLCPISVLATSVVCFSPLSLSACCVLIIYCSRRAFHYHLPFVQ
ncbi:expressed protein [Echinococcus multilocularis]|uniref:Expressed protein n=1 Tax=Echinococcus multilocularis TaxID=6211 RepID=A0A068Y9Z2_ECHMU|nr:expressed protein [Echinococcus multilocularis]